MYRRWKGKKSTMIFFLLTNDRTFDLFKRTNVPLRDYYLSGPGCPKRFNAITVLPDAAGAKSDPDPFKVTEMNGGSVPDE